MDELDLSGKKYISSKRAAELTGYAKDYIGQLARAGKISATRFGRAWYVEESSILAHANADKAENAIPEPIKTLSEGVKTTTPPVRPQLPQHFYKPYSFPNTWRSVKYLDDASELFPALAKGAIEPSEITNENIATSAKVDIHAEKNGEIKNPKSGASEALSNVPIRIIPGINFDIPQPRKIPVSEVRIAPVRTNSHQVSTSPNFVPYAVIGGAAALLAGSYTLLGIAFQSNFIDIANTGFYTASVFSSVSGFLSQIVASEYVREGVAAVLGFVNLLLGSFWSFAQQGYDFILHLF